jgi:hypothetical protein
MSCAHRQKLRATNVSAIVDQTRQLRGGPGEPIMYEELVFCSSPICEQVFKATRAK